MKAAASLFLFCDTVAAAVAVVAALVSSVICWNKTWGLGFFTAVGTGAVTIGFFKLLSATGFLGALLAFMVLFLAELPIALLAALTYAACSVAFFLLVRR